MQTLKGSVGIARDPYSREPSQNLILAQADLSLVAPQIRSTYNFRQEKVLQQTKSGITAIDLYYENLDQADESEALRYSIEFRRLVQ